MTSRLTILEQWAKRTAYTGKVTVNFHRGHQRGDMVMSSPHTMEQLCQTTEQSRGAHPLPIPPEQT